MTRSNCPPSPIGEERRCCTSLLSSGSAAKSIIHSKKSISEDSRRNIQFAFSNLSQKKRYCCENSNSDSLNLLSTKLIIVLLVHNAYPHDIGACEKPTSIGTPLIRNGSPLNLDLIGEELKTIVDHRLALANQIKHITLSECTQRQTILGI